MGAQRKILVIDDAELFRDLESLFLTRLGEVITASSGHQGLAAAIEKRPDVVVVDLHMADLDGTAVCRSIKCDPDLKETPVILVTSGEDPHEHATAVRAGADDVIAKPINRVTLIQAVNRLLNAGDVQGLTRVPVEARVRIRHECEDAWGTMRNLSRGGLFVTAARTVPPETEVQLEFELPEMCEALHPTAKVIWRREASPNTPEGMGMRFLELDRAAAVRIDDYVYTHEEQPMQAAPLAEAGGTR